MGETKQTNPIREGTKITIENSTVCLPGMGGYPEYVYRAITVLSDGYHLTSTVSDGIRPISYEDRYIDKGFFANSSMEEIVRMLNRVACYCFTTVENVKSNTLLMELIEYDKRFVK